MYPGEEIKIEKTTILIFITFILYQYNARNDYCCESLTWSPNKQCRTSVNTLFKQKSTECKLGDFDLLNYRMTIACC